jgi:capsular polysaccharide biosynthesis protein
MRKAFLARGGKILLVLGLMIGITTPVITFILPVVYASTARILPGAAEPSALATEMEKLQSEVILDQVITNLNFNRVWADKYREAEPLPTAISRQILKTHLDIRRSKNTLIVDINVYSQDREEAAAIANEIAKVYQNSQLALTTSEGKPALQLLQQATPAFRPAKPNKTLNITIGCVVGVVLFGVGLFLLRLSRQPSVPPVLQPH